jgi:hypothetical protein
MNPIHWQRLEGGVIAAACLAATILSGEWPWLLALFLVFDGSMVGYLGGTKLGAWLYNVTHIYVGPVAFGIAYALFGVRWAGILALAWAFHIGVDRALGYGLKFDDKFQHTHLGTIGRKARSSRP